MTFFGANVNINSTTDKIIMLITINVVMISINILSSPNVLSNFPCNNIIETAIIKNVKILLKHNNI